MHLPAHELAHARAQILSLVVTATTRTAGARIYLLLFFGVWCGIETLINRHRIGDRAMNRARGHALLTDETAAAIPDFRKLGLFLGLIAVVVAWARYRDWGMENHRLLLELLTNPVRAPARSPVLHVHASDASAQTSASSIVPGQIDQAPALVTRGTSTDRSIIIRKIPTSLDASANSRGITLYAVNRVETETASGRRRGRTLPVRFHAGRDEMLN